MTPAKQTDWQTIGLPSKKRTVRLSRTFSAPEMQRIQLGLVPEQMEDKWFIYWQDHALYFHRSWTGYCVYVARFEINDDACHMFEADLNRDSEQYSETSDVHDAAMISYLIDVLLLQQDADFPSNDPDCENTALKQWSEVGRAMLGQHPGHDEGAEPDTPSG